MVWFVDGDDRKVDPRVYRLNNERSPGISVADEHVSGFLTWAVVFETLTRRPWELPGGAFGKLRRDVRFLEARPAGSEDALHGLNLYDAWDEQRGWPEYGPRVADHLEKLGLRRWDLPGMKLEIARDESLLRHDRGLVVLTAGAWKTIEPLLGAESEEVAQRKKDHEARRSEEVTRELEELGATGASSDDLLASLDAIKDRLTFLEKIHVDDLRASIERGTVVDGQRMRAWAILARYGKS
jgi:hypothetical protein